MSDEASIKYRELGSVKLEFSAQDAGGVLSNEVFTCSRCGSVVADTEAHNRWHVVNAIGLG